MSDPPPAVLRADAVVVGSGAGGAPVAAALAEAGLEVLVLEAGPRLGTGDFDGDAASLLARLMTARNAADSGMELFAGACVGGSTVVNDALCWRPPPEILAAWRRDHGLSGLRDEVLAPYVDRVWRDVHAAPTDRAHTNRNAHLLALGARRLGWASEAMPRNVRGCANLGLCNLGCPSGAKQSMLRTYLPRAEAAGARVMAGVRVERIEVTDGRVRGVEAVRVDPATGAAREPLRVEAPRVCLAAGVLAAPAILQRSGVAAGEGIQLHSSVYVTARFAEPVHGYYGPTMARAVTEFADVHGRRGSGFMLESVGTMPVTAAAGLPGTGAEHARRMAALPHLARCVVVLRDRTRGRLRADPDGTVRLDYDPVASDRERLRDAVRAAARLYLAAGAEEVHLPLHGFPAVRREGDLEPLERARFGPRDLSQLYAVHLFGGAAMGGDARGVCDEAGRVRGAAGLYVSDASVLPGNTGANPQITIMANALRIADGVAAETGA